MKTISRLTSATTEWQKNDLIFTLYFNFSQKGKKMELKQTSLSFSAIPALVRMIHRILVFEGEGKSLRGEGGCTTNEQKEKLTKNISRNNICRFVWQSNKKWKVQRHHGPTKGTEDGWFHWSKSWWMLSCITYLFNHLFTFFELQLFSFFLVNFSEWPNSVEQNEKKRKKNIIVISKQEKKK